METPNAFDPQRHLRGQGGLAVDQIGQGRPAYADDFSGGAPPAGPARSEPPRGPPGRQGRHDDFR